VANLLLARATRRQREIAIRIAMGVDRSALARLVLTESALLGLAGGLAALLVTLWAGPVVRAFLLPHSPALASPVDSRVLAFTAVAALAAGLVAGLAPALQLGRTDLTPALKTGAGEGRYHRSRMRTGLLVGQVALTVVLLVGAGLFVRSLRNVQGQTFGFDLTQTLLATTDLRTAGYRSAEINAMYLRMLERVAAVPGVEHAAVTVGHSFGWSFGGSARVPGRDSIPSLPTGGPYYQTVTPDYFAAMGTPVRGRAFTAADRGAPVAIVNETMARLVWPGEAALGKCFYARDDKRCAQVVGVVPGPRRVSAVEDATMMFYLPFTSDTSDVVTALVARVRGRAEDFIAPVGRTMQATVAALPYARVTTLSDLVAPSIRPWRLGSTMFGAFAVLALMLASVGLYGVLAYTVAQRTHEVGIRVALGALRRDVLRMVVLQGVKVAVLGTAVGAVIALLAGRVLRSLLYGVTAHDPLVLLLAVVTPVLVAALASYLPARRATRVDPMVALRYE
jgi:predicted permease